MSTTTQIYVGPFILVRLPIMTGVKNAEQELRELVIDYEHIVTNGMGNAEAAMSTPDLLFMAIIPNREGFCIGRPHTLDTPGLLFIVSNIQQSTELDKFRDDSRVNEFAINLQSRWPGAASFRWGVVTGSW